jgi:NADH-quinone oxidoreductase subunit N
VSAFLSAGAKVAGFAVLIRVAQACPMDGAVMVSVVSVLAVLTMTLGNLGAVRQEGLKRLMAYSSVAHSGYALVALAGGGASAPAAVMNYVFVYAVMNFCAFGLILALEQDNKIVKDGGQLTLASLQGLGFEKPVFSFCLAVCMFSMAGIPPSAGFIAKLNVFKSALDAHQSKLVVLAVLNSVISAAYYLRVLVALYMKPRSSEGAEPAFNGLLLGSSLVCVALILYWGVMPGSLLALTNF